jgi:hypothetical protein
MSEKSNLTFKALFINKLSNRVPEEEKFRANVQIPHRLHVTQIRETDETLIFLPTDRVRGSKSGQ